MAQLDVQVAGVPLTFPVTDDSKARLERQWSRCLYDGARATDDPPTEVPGLPLVEDEDGRDAAEYAIVSGLTLAGIGAHHGKRLMLHAAGLSDQDGRTVVLVGASGAGKTTAALTLALNGFGYVTDETVVIDDDGAITPYPKPLSLRMTGELTVAKRQHGPDELGLGPTPADPVVGRTVILHRVAEAGWPWLESVPLLSGLMEVIPQTSALPSLSRPLQRLAEAATRRGDIVRLTYHEIADAPAVLLDLLGEERPADETTTPAFTAVTTEDDATVEQSWEALSGALPSDAQVGRRPVLDALQVDDEALVMTPDGRALHLTGLGATIWLRLDQVRDVVSVVDWCQEQHGANPDASALVAEAVRELVSADVLGVLA